jgi:hypothetical protein
MKKWFVKLDGSKVILPSGVVRDWSMHGPNCQEAVDMFNDFNDYGNWCMILGAGMALLGVATAITINTIHILRKNKKSKKEA